MDLAGLTTSDSLDRAHQLKLDLWTENANTGVSGVTSEIMNVPKKMTKSW